MWGELAASPRGQGVLMFVLRDPAKDRAPADKPGLAAWISPLGLGAIRSGPEKATRRSARLFRANQLRQRQRTR